MHTKTKEAVDVILNADEADFLEAFDVLRERYQGEVDLTEEEIEEVNHRLKVFIAGGRKGISEEELENRLQAKGL